MRYMDVVPSNIATKLVKTSFRSPEVNARVWEYSICVNKIYSFMQSELSKIVELDEGVDYYEKLLKTEIPECFELPILNITANDFIDGNCRYDSNSDFWLNAIDINFIIEYCKRERAD